MTAIEPWAKGPFELLVHAETHHRSGEDYDRPIALINFDNAIEVAITTYLTLHPAHRKNREYNTQEVDKWLRSYHSRLDFLECEVKSRKGKWVVEKLTIIWIHRQRNEQYHGDSRGVPEKSTLDLARQAALWVFSFLFEVSDIETELENTIFDRNPIQRIPPREKHFDEAINSEYYTIEIGDQIYLASDVLYAADYTAYRDIGERLSDSE